jgi:tryptophan 2,3-dioxygenase
MEITTELIERIKLLNDKYARTGQDLLAYLDGLIHGDYLKYWDYIELDTLLSLQKPRTNIPDEEIFIIYHQITELYFKLTLKEIGNLSDNPIESGDYFLNRLGRIIRYFETLVNSFEVMVNGMDPKEFMKFRMALLPASGFQSVQYRKIELQSTDLINLISADKRPIIREVNDISELYAHIYWKQGAIDNKTQKKTLTLIQFEERYDQELILYSTENKQKNLWQRYLSLDKDSKSRQDIKEAMRRFDLLVNVDWPLAHYKSAVRYLQTKTVTVEATGGTNWQKYLPPRYQKLIFFPELWTKEEMDNWGRAWVEETLKA